jgi:hypothetical protein
MSQSLKPRGTEPLPETEAVGGLDASPLPENGLPLFLFPLTHSTFDTPNGRFFVDVFNAVGDGVGCSKTRGLSGFPIARPNIRATNAYSPQGGGKLSLCRNVNW